MFTTFEQLHNRYFEPPEADVLGRDWRDNEIHFGERYYEIEGDYVLKDDLKVYMKEVILKKYGTIVRTFNRYTEQGESVVFTYDWRGNEIYFGEEHYILFGDCIVEDDLEDYAIEIIASELRVAEEQLC